MMVHVQVGMTITIILLVLATGVYLIITRMGGDTSTQLERIIAARRTWDVDFASSFGQPIADFSVRDITGTEHKLSDYRGKHVVVVFWATWCPACNEEIPHLIKLRDTLSPDKLQILAISNEPPELLKPFVDSKQINYIVATANSPLPPPLNRVRGIPATFFIDPDGKLKLAAVGVISLEEDIAIINTP